MGRPPLRSVAPDEVPVEVPDPPKPLSVEQAAATGNTRVLLVAMRKRVAEAISAPDCPARDLAALTRRLQDIVEKLEAIDLRAKEEGADAADLQGDEEWDGQEAL